jgi:elongation factor 2
MIPIDNNRFAAFGRVFSGTVKAGEKVRIMGPNYKFGQNKDLFQKNVSQVGIFMMGKTPEYVADVPCGNTVALIGIDDYILKTGTIANV